MKQVFAITRGMPRRHKLLSGLHAGVAHRLIMECLEELGELDNTNRRIAHRVQHRGAPGI